MTRAASKEMKVRLNLEVPERVRENLDRLRELADADSMTEVVRRALMVYDALLTAHKEGAKVVVRRRDGREETLFLC